MNKHRDKVRDEEQAVPEAVPETLRSGKKNTPAREVVARMVYEANRRVRAPLVAKKLKKGQSTVHGWGYSANASGLRVVDLLRAPTPWGESIARSLLAEIEPPRTGFPTQRKVAQHLSLAAALLLAASEGLPVAPTEEELQRLRELSSALGESARASDQKRQEIDEYIRQMAATQKTRS